ncbi:probable disease resistance protein At4g27220 [Gossypium raimondii]|uniref:Uncharacterized protein n=1 Tax=Gossypium raimondii TaxID=29730 RepID=A0A0D2R0R1_GOSRA|nr:probable disease resistance protein At4g27220 [Gossypium raimondii]XP_052485963.1 probable disease resistance protein At4g27220 [Gossypium raimondii]XP_052485964.1 probable disease resistance protein At4g27220 [Gossypium raimondii]XP_052485967.1 probable disease resistance protein At4g27220 [Gossypium raimondii]XP_052485970.1 probable disease resistance protein At4g27220 [Gossypium raimondii]XP_052485971.1 probable disease resistance protein At4g27220 [Gossypium raimondii]KJB12960.1 hypoth
MAGAFFTGAASNAVGTLMGDYLVKPIDRRIRYLFRFHKLIKDLHQQQSYLKREQIRVEEDVKEAKLQIQTQVIEDYVDEWLTNVENALKDVQNLDSRVEGNNRCLHWCPNWCWRYQLGKEIEKKTVYISKLVEDSHFERIGYRAELPGLEFFTSKDILAAKSSTAAFNKIMEALKDDKVNMIGVWGMGGVGKTTLVKEVGKKTKDLGCFRKVIEVVVSQKSIIENIQDKIADFLDLEFKKKTKEGRAGELWLRLENEEKVLIILDDMWNEVHLKEIGIPLNENGKGCKIILTTRLMKVCDSMECQVIIPVDVLDSDEAWGLFRKKANLNERVSRDILEEAEKVAEECKGLPVAIVTLAAALKKTETRGGWKVARKKLESSRLVEIGNIGEEERNAYLCIKMSYENLKKETTKRCFLWCGLYPEDHSIEVEDLVRYAWCLELFGKADSIGEVRIQVLEAIDYLKDSCLLFEDGDGRRYVKLHDIIRDVALWIASEENSGFMIKSRLELLNKSSESCKAISLLDSEKKNLPDRLALSKLEILLLKNCDIQGICFLGMRELKVLSLISSTGVISLYALSSLQKLRALHLENFKDFSFLGNLRTLEILSLRHSELNGLADELGRLKDLKMLDLTNCALSSSFSPNVIRRFSQLEELYLSSRTNDIFLVIKSLTRLTRLNLWASSLHFPPDFEFPELEKYNICINYERTFFGRIFYAARSLHIDQEVFPYNAVSQLLGNLESLAVSGIKDEYVECLTNKTQQKVSVSMILRNLKQVTIKECSNLKVVFQMEEVEENGAPLLSNLKILRLDRLPHLSCIWQLPTQHVRLESLVYLTIRKCPRLKSLFSLSLAQSLVLLEELDILFCDELKQIVTELEGDEGEISSAINSHTSLCFPKLTKLEIYICDGLEYIFPTSLASHGLQGFTLRIHGCPKLKQVFRVANDSMLQYQQSWRSLSSFSMSGCPLLTDSVVHLEAGKAYIEGVRLSAFKESFKTLKQLTLLKIEDHNLVPEANEDGLNGVTSLHLENCEDLECLVDTTATATKNGPTSAFSHLEKLFIGAMPRLEALCKGQPPQGFLKNLKHLGIVDCCKLKSLFSPSLIQSLVLLEQLEIRCCDELKTLFADPEIDGEIESKTSSLPLRLPKLNTLYIRACAKLEYVVPITLAQGLPALEWLWVSECDALKQVFGMPNEQNEVHHHSSLLLPSLQDLELDWLRNLTSFVPKNYIVKAPSLKRMKAKGCSKVMNLPIQQANNQLELTLEETGLSVFKELLCNTNDLILYNIGDHKNLVPDLIDLEHLDGLTSLSINNWQGGECLVDISQAMMDFKYNDQSPKCFLQNLKSLRAVFCEDLSKIFRMDDGIESNAYYLSNLEILEIERCCSLEYVFPHASVGVFSYLRNIKLVGLRNLRSIVGGNNSLEAPILEILHIEECSVFTNFTFPKEVKKCGSLKELFFSMEDIDSEDVNLCDMVNTQLRQKSPDFEYITLGNFEQLFQLQSGNIISSLEKMELFNVIRLRDIWKGPIQVATNLREIRVYCCNNLTYIFPETLIPHLPQLSILDIASCENLKQIIGNDDILESSSSSQGPQLEMKMVFPQLKKIELENLSKLESFSPMGYHLEFPCLHSLDIKECSKMITSFSADYLTLTVHAKTDQASQLNDTSPSREDIIWKRRRPTSLPQYKEEAEEISPFQ